MQGGYYAVNLSSEVMLITLNGMYPFYDNFVQQANGTSLMFDWLQQVLTNNSDKYFMTQTHVYFGNNYYQGLEQMWVQ